jgi:hypothetical protein
MLGVLLAVVVINVRTGSSRPELRLLLRFGLEDKFARRSVDEYAGFLFHHTFHSVCRTKLS